MYDELFLDEIIDKNPFTRVKNLSVQSREPEPFTAEEIARILNELTEQEKNLIQFAFWSGLRTSELISLRWQDVDFENNRIFVRQAKVRGHIKTTKTKAGTREVTLQPQAKETLLNQLTHTGKTSETVFHDSRKNEPWKNDQAIRKIVWQKALLKAGISYREPYQTRHTFASTLLSRGENPLWVPGKWATKIGL